MHANIRQRLFDACDNADSFWTRKWPDADGDDADAKVARPGTRVSAAVVSGLGFPRCGRDAPVDKELHLAEGEAALVVPAERVGTAGALDRRAFRQEAF